MAERAGVEEEVGATAVEEREEVVKAAATEAVRAVAASVAASVAERAAVALWVETLAPRLSAQIHRRQ